uniref:Putative axon guidance receptor dscam n=1 Tax=Culex tarsalis TaxID=7177 RepID=A0A1Q3FR61_CULTA
MRISWLVLALSSAHFAIISTASSNATDNDELWTLLLSRRLDQIKTKTAAEVKPAVSVESSEVEPTVHSQTASGNINYGKTTDDDADKAAIFDDEQLFDGVQDDNETVSTAMLFDEAFASSGDGEGGEELDGDDKDGMQADAGRGMEDEIIDVLRRQPASREVLGLLGLLKERNKTEDMKQKLKNVVKPMSERITDGLPSILEDKEVPPEVVEPVLAESLVSDSTHTAPVTSILIPKLGEKLSAIRKTYEAPADGQRSLVIVFDATGSMLDDLHQLREGAKLIIDEITQLKNNPIYNYVFVPFRDPQVGPRLVTRNKEELLQALENLQIYGGGDCPENAMAALSDAIEASLPNSFVYVFTDATAKDFKLDQRVLRLVQQKQTPITFLLTGFCDGRDTPGHEVMRDIAAASNGQIIDLKKDQIEQVLVSIKGMLDIDHVPLKAVDSKQGETHDIDLNVDGTLKEFSVSVSGHRPSIEIIDPHKVPYNNTKSVLDLENIKVVNVAGPSPGKWNIKAGSNSSNSVRLSGNSDVKFNFGFSPSKPASIGVLSRQPVLNVDNVLTVQPSQPNLVGNLSHVTIDSHDTNQVGATNFKFNLKLHPHQLEDSTPVFVTPGFQTPRQKFKISVVGSDSSGNPLDRLISTAIQAVGLTVPEMSLDIADVELLEGDSLKISCRADSASAMLVQWKRYDRLLAESSFDSTGVLDLALSNVTTKQSGRYTCRAANSVGEQEIVASVKVSLRPEPEVGVYPKDIVAFEGERLLFLRCILKNIDSSASVVWSHNGNKLNHAIGKEYLEIHNITSKDDGSYECRVESNGRIHWDSTRLSVEYGPKAPNAPLMVTAPYGRPLNVECGLSGNPKPAVSWSFQSLEDSEEQALMVQDFNLSLPTVTPDVEGFYTCEGINRHGSAKSVVFVRGDANDPPRIPKPEEQILYVKPGAKVVLNCSCDLCQPLSEYIWTNGRLKFESSAYEVQGNVRVYLNVEQSRNAIQYRLTIDDFSAEDQGSYSCILSNAHGADSIVTEVRLMETPQVDGVLVNDNPSASGEEFIGLEDSVNYLTCDATGLPEPKIQWFVNGTALNDDQPFTLLNDNKTLFLIEVFDQSYAGKYSCVASNPMGSSTGELSLLYGSAPAFSNQPPSTLNVEVDDRVALECDISGFPRPSIVWYFNDRSLNTSEISFVANLEHSGLYTCSASNSFGQLSSTTMLLVHGKPQFKIEPPEDAAIAVSKQQNVTLQCIATGYPKPNITWSFEGNPVNASSNVIDGETVLTITNISTLNQGSYVCNAENALGSVQKVYYLLVKEPPKITTTHPNRVQLLPNQKVLLDCVGTGNPPPIGTWTKNGIPIRTNTSLELSHSAESSGNYTCTLENVEGSDSQTTEVVVIDPPRKAANFSTPPVIQTRINSPLTLVCPFDNYESLLWQLNERNLDSYLDLTDVRLLQNILQIEKLRQAHQGTYTCFVENPAGRDNHSFVVGILSPPTIQQAHPELAESIAPAEEQNQQQVAEVSLLSGEQLRLVCHASGSPPPAITWNRDNAVLTRGSELAIESVDSHHTGLYTCVAENDLGVARKMYRLDVMSSPQHWGEPTSYVEVFKDEDLSLECGMHANPPASNQWSKENEILDEFDDVLELNTIQPHDSGLYTCEAENIFGTAQKKYHVTVYQPAEIVAFPANQTIIAGTVFSLECEAVGSPLPIVSIIHKGEILASSADLEVDGMMLDQSYRVKSKPYAIQTQQFLATKLSHHELRLSLSQSNVAEGSAGKYLCLAQNAVGYDERSSKVVIYVPPYVQLNKLKAGRTFAILEGLPLYLFCPIGGYPRPALSWFRNGKPIKFNGQTLFLSSTSRKDQGNYTCLGENSVGKAELSFSVSILIPPTMINSVVVGDDEVADEPEQEEISILKGDNVTLDCASLGNPKPEIFWIKVVYLDEKLNEQLATKDAVLELYNIESTSTYSCYVNNTAGSTQKLFHIVVQSPPRFKTIEYDPKPAVSLHHSLDLNCELVGVPEAEVQWTKDDVVVASGQQKGLFLASNGHVLRISSARDSDGGQYKCVGRNLHGQVSREFLVTIEVPVSWSPWGEWSACSATCGKGTQFRSRICLLPSGSPAHGKQYNCVGENVEVKNCEMLPCPVNGGWSAWTRWSNCSLECVTEHSGLRSLRFRNRKCDSPPPSLGGKPCVGEEYEEEICSVKFCPTDGGWTPWTKWTPCSETCGFGRTLRWRSCVNPAPRNGGLPCQGSESEIKICKERECIVDGGWSEWSQWSKCSKTCGVGVRSRKRTCENPEPKNGGRECEGENVELEKCSSKSCRNDALVKHIQRDNKRKYSPLITYESKYPVKGDSDYEDQPSEPQKFKVVRNFEFAETPPVEYVDGPVVETNFDDLDDGHHQITVSLKNTVNLTQDTAAYNLNFGGRANSVEYVCAAGMIFNETLRRCVDLNECETGEHRCTELGQICVNTNSGYECRCTEGFRMTHGGRCIDIDECREESHDCSHFCVNNPGGYSCLCPTGHLLAADGKTCTRRRTREEPAFSIMNYETNCPEGYLLDRNKCLDIDECALKEDECNEEQSCLNTKGSYLCVPTACPEEYDTDILLNQCYQDCREAAQTCPDGALIEQTLTYKVISLKRYSSKQPIAVLSIPAVQHASMRTNFAFLERTYEHVFSLEKTPQSATGGGAVYLYGNKKFQRGKIYKLKVVARAFGVESGTMDYVHRFVVYVHCVE